MKQLKTTLYVLSLIVISISAQAKWASFENASIKSSYHQEINIDDNGKTSETREVQFEILKEPGRNIAASYTLRYNGASQKIKIIDAKTIYKNKEYKLDKNLIEDKPLASAHHGFDQTKQILLAFPKAEIGAKIYLKYNVITTEVPLDKFYASVFDFGTKEFTDKSYIKLHSKIPLHVLINDPEKTLKIKKDSQDNFHDLEITLTKPIYKEVINEPISNIVNNKYLTWVSVSCLSKWEDLALKFGKLYEKVFTQNLPKDFAKIAEDAKQQKEDIDQINTVTSMLNDKVRYMGDWRTIKGGFIPRNLDIISKTQLGDCKDFAASTAAILTKLGFKAQVALVRRGSRSFYPESLPDLMAFNHALVKVTTKQGKIYWIDPTNFQSMAGGIFQDIEGKAALILDPKQPSYERVFTIDPSHSQSVFKRQIKVIEDNRIIEKGNLTLKNEEACDITGAALQTSETNIKDILFNYLSHANLEEKNKKKLHLPDLKSRIVKDISFDYAFEQEDRILKTNLGQAIKLTYDSIAVFLNISQDYVSDILCVPFTTTRQTIIKNVNAQNIQSLNKEIKTPWLYVSRKCIVNDNNDLQIDDTIIAYNHLITNEDIKKPEFAKLKSELKKDFNDVAVVFTKK